MGANDVRALVRARSPVDTLEGVRVVQDDGWALVLPDPAEAMTRVWAEGATAADARALLDAWTDVVERAGR